MFYTDFSAYLLLLASVVGFSLVLVMTLRKRPLSYYFFAMELMAMSLSCLVLAAVKTGWIMEFPHLYQTAAPLHYLIGPSCYFFVRLNFSEGYRFSAIDILHFAPAILHLAELTPFFLLSGSEKLRIIGEFGDRKSTRLNSSH